MGDSYRDPFTPDVPAGSWQIAVIWHWELNLCRTVFSVGNQHFTLAETDASEDGVRHCSRMRVMFERALGKIGVKLPVHGPVDTET